MSDHFEKDYQYHQAIAQEYDSVVVQPRTVTNNVLFNKFDHFIKPSDRMLDLACGTGHMTLRFGHKFKEVIAVDHSDAMLAQVKKKVELNKMSNVFCIKSDIFSFLESYKDESFNFVSCTGFLHHLLPSQLLEVLKKIYKLLKTDGLILISEPISTGVMNCPKPVQVWNQHSIAAKLFYSVEATEPDEAPLDAKNLIDLVRVVGFKISKEYRNWEIFPKNATASFFDQVAIRALNAIYGKHGNVLTLAAFK